MLQKLLDLEKVLDEFYKKMKREISEMKENLKPKEEKIPVRHDGCSLKSPAGLRSVWN